MKKIVFGISALAVFLGVGWMLDWYIVEYAIGIPILVLFWFPALVAEYDFGLSGEIPGFVIQCIALLAILVATLPIGDFRLGDFFKNNRRHSLLVVLPLGLFTWIILCALIPFSVGVLSDPVLIATALLMAALAIIALCSLHIVVFLRAEQTNISKDVYSLNTGVFLDTEHANMPRDLLPYILRVSMLSVAILSILSLGLVDDGLALQWIIMLVTASVCLVIRIFISGDFSENNLLFVAAVLPMPPITVLWASSIVAGSLSWPESWS